MPYVYSTLTCDNLYHHYERNETANAQEPGIITASVLIKGGTGVATKHLVTPMGVVTSVSDEELDFLKKDKNFQEHVKNGFITFDKVKVDPEVAAGKMETRDKSAPYVPQDVKEDELAQPSEDFVGEVKGMKRNTGKVTNNLR